MLEFKHQHTAHCETGVLSTLFQHDGLDLDEAMIFGLGSGITFAYLPIIKLMGMPLISYRMPPGKIIKNTCQLLNIKLKKQTFKQENIGMQTLNQMLDQNRPVGLQTSVFWLPYFPDEMRFHFNAHHLIVYGYEKDHYYISDPVFEEVQTCSAKDLQQARFAKGVLSAKGAMFTLEPNSIPKASDIDWAKVIKSALKKSSRQMLAPVFFIGVKGIHTLAKRIAILPQKYDKRHCKQYIGHIVRMQEEIGTGGAGFRFIYAYFLEQCSDRLNYPELKRLSEKLTKIGDDWRQFAVNAVTLCRADSTIEEYRILANQLHAIADDEKILWQQLSSLSRTL